MLILSHSDFLSLAAADVVLGSRVKSIDLTLHLFYYSLQGSTSTKEIQSKLSQVQIRFRLFKFILSTLSERIIGNFAK